MRWSVEHGTPQSWAEICLTGVDVECFWELSVRNGRHVSCSSPIPSLLFLRGESASTSSPDRRAGLCRGCCKGQREIEVSMGGRRRSPPSFRYPSSFRLSYLSNHFSNCLLTRFLPTAVRGKDDHCPARSRHPATNRPPSQLHHNPRSHLNVLTLNVSDIRRRSRSGLGFEPS